MKIIMNIIMIILMTNIVTAFSQCDYQMYESEIPCYILLPVNKSITSCDTINVTFYLDRDFEGSVFMEDYNDIYCFANFTYTTLGIHSIGYSTQDSGSINVVSDFDGLFWIYVLTSMTFIFLVVYGFMTENHFYLIIGGFLGLILAVALLTIGFPLLSSDFLKNTISTILIGLGGYLIMGSYFDMLDKGLIFDD